MEAESQIIDIHEWIFKEFTSVPISNLHLIKVSLLCVLYSIIFSLNKWFFLFRNCFVFSINFPTYTWKILLFLLFLSMENLKSCCLGRKIWREKDRNFIYFWQWGAQVEFLLVLECIFAWHERVLINLGKTSDLEIIWFWRS